jgi:hypothetical protein
LRVSLALTAASLRFFAAATLAFLVAVAFLPGGSILAAADRDRRCSAALRAGDVNMTKTEKIWNLGEKIEGVVLRPDQVDVRGVFNDAGQYALSGIGVAV